MKLLLNLNYSKLSFLFTLLALFIFSNRLHAQNCVTSLTLTNQSDVDNFVAAHSSSGCNTINGNLTIYRSNLDLSGLAFIDSIKGKLIITAIYGGGEINLTGLTTLKAINNGIKLQGITNTSLPMINLIKLKGDIEIESSPNLQNLNFLPTSLFSAAYPYRIEFRYCQSLQNFSSINNLTSVGTLYFQNTGITSYTLPSNLNDISNLTFLNNASLTTLNISNTNLYIHNSMSIRSNALVSINIHSIDANFLHIDEDISTLVFTNPTSRITHLSLETPLLTSLNFLPNIDGVITFYISYGGTTLTELVNTNFAELRRLTIENCPNLTSITGLPPAVDELDRLTIHNCGELLNLSGFSQLNRIGNINYETYDYEGLRISNNSKLTSIDDLNLDLLTGELIVINNPMLQGCCSIKDFVFPTQNFYNNPVVMFNNGEACSNFNLLEEIYCDNADGDMIVTFFDNCPNVANNDQLDSDADGLGDACDPCPLPIDINFTSQTEINNFFAEPSNYESCVINNVNISGSTIVDLRPFTYFKKINGNLIVSNCPNLQSFDGLDSIKYVAGNLEIATLNSLRDIDGLSHIDSISGNLFLGYCNSLETIEPLTNLEKVGGFIAIQVNPKLKYCCCMYPFLLNEKQHSGLFLESNLSTCINANLGNECSDSDNDSVLNINDNCKLIFNTKQYDIDQDGVGDVCDNCPSHFNPDQINTDGDSKGDVCDNCPLVFQAANNFNDNDNDGIGNACEASAGAQSGFIGLSTTQPKSKLHVEDGDILITNIHRGVIMKSPNGNCYRLTVNNDGTISSIKINCP